MVNGVSRSRTRRSCMVRRFAPEFVKRWNRFRAVVRASRQTINFVLSARCDVTAPQGHDRTVGRPVHSAGAYTLRALVASHAKPWTDSTDVEKLDTSNGLLLAGTLDKVYDGYLMSVHPETGELLFSDAIDEAERARLAGGPYAPAQDTHGRTGCLPGGALPALPCEEGGTLLQAAQLA